MANFSFSLLKKDTNRHDKFYVYLTITHKRKLARYRTSVEIPTANCWNAEKEYVYARANTPDAKNKMMNSID